MRVLDLGAKDMERYDGPFSDGSLEYSDAFLSCMDALREWLASEGLGGRKIYRLDVHETHAVVYEYAVNDKGARYFSEYPEIAKLDPYVHQFKTRPPAEFDRWSVPA